MTMLDIVTVVFEEELDILQVQAQSIDRFCKNLQVGCVYVIVNDTAQVAEKIQRSWWGSFEHCVRVVPRDVFDTKFVDNGWVSQQALKLLSARLSHNQWSMILDAKTLVANHMTPELFFAENNQLTLGLMPVQEVFAPAAQIASGMFGIEVTHVAEPTGVPFIIENALVRQMMSDIQDKTGLKFSEWFQDQGRLTEFVLYSAYVKHHYNTLEAVYLGTNTKTLSNNICHSEVARFDQKLQQAKHNQTYTIGLHRRAWQQLSMQQKQNYVDHLISLGLARARMLL